MKFDLKGLRVLNTRPIGQQHALSEAIRRAGGVPIECPTLAIERVSGADTASSLEDLVTFNQVVFISRNAVHFFLEPLEAISCPWPATIRVLAIGQATAESLQARGIRVDDVPVISNSEGLLQLASLQCVQHQQILLVKGVGGRDLIEETLVARGADVHLCEVYRRLIPETSRVCLQLLWHNDALDVVVLTSEEAMVNLFLLLDPTGHNWLKRKVFWVMSDRLAKAAIHFGIKQSQIKVDSRIK